MWFDILKEEETPHRMWPKPKELFEQNPERALGYVMSYWYIKHQQEIDAWVNSQGNLEGVFYDELCVGPDLTECKTSLDRYARGERVKFYRFGMGGFYIFDRVKIQEYISDNKELLQKLGIPMDVDALVKYISEVPRHDDEGYNFIAQLFGDVRKRTDNPLRIHRREVKFRGKQRGFE